MKTFFQYALAALTLILSAFTPLPAAAVPIGCDEDVTATISANGEVDEYTFTGQTGDRIIIRMQGEINLDPKIDLYGPTGVFLTSAMNSSNGLARIGTPPFQLPANGTYTIRVSDVGNNDTGNYGLSLQILKTSCAASIGCTDDLDGQLGKMAQMNCYYFSGQTGETVIARMQGAVNVDAAIELYGPNGQLIEGDLNASNGLARLGALPLPSTGTYFLVVMDDEGSDVEDYGLSLQFLKTSCATSIGCADDLDGTLSKMAQMNCYYFTGQANETIIARMQGAVNVDAAIELYGPNGLVDDALNASNGLARIGALQLTDPGTYFLVVMDDEGSDVEDYGLSLQFLKTSCASPIGCTDDLDGQLGKMAQMNCYYFSGQTGETVIARMQGAVNVDAAIELYGPNGQLIEGDLNASNGLARLGALPLPSTGTYFLVVMDDEGSDVEDYGLSLQFLKTSCATSIGCADDLDGTLSKMAQMNCYYFTGQANETIIARMQGAVNVDAAIELYGPNGLVDDALNASNGLARIGALQLPTTGTYFLVVMDDEGSDIEDYGLSLQILKTSCAASIGCTDDLDGQLGKMAEMDCYWFNAQAGERFIIWMQGEVNLDAAIELYGPNGYFQQDINASNGLASLGVLQLPADGTYFLVVMDDEGSDTDAYGLSLQMLKTSCTQWLGCGGDAGAAIDKPAEMDAYTFSAQAGQKVIVRSNETGFGFDPGIKMYRLGDPQFEYTFNVGNSLREIYTIPATDTFFLVYRDNTGDGAGAYGLSVQVLDPGCAAPLTCLQDTTGTLGHLSKTDAYRISGLAGQKVLLRAFAPTFAEVVEIYNASGQIVTTFEAGTSGLTELLWTIPANGDYLVLLLDKTGNQTGNYGFSCQFINLACVDDAPACGASFLTTIDKLAQVRAYDISIPAGHRVVVRGVPAQTGLDLHFELFNTVTGGSYGTADLANGQVRIDRQNTVMPESLLLLVTDNNGDETGGFYFSVQKIGGQVNCGAEISCADGNTAAVPISLPGEMKAVRFLAVNGEQGILRLGTESGNAVARAELYAPDGSSIGTSQSGATVRFDYGPVQSGFYTLLVMSNSSTGTGNIAVARAPKNVFNCGATVQYNTNLLPNLANRVNMTSLELLNANAGDVVVCMAKGVSSTFDANIEIYRNGQLIGQDIGINSLARINDGTIILTSGSHKIIVMENEGDEAGNFGFSLQKVNPGVNAPTLPLGSFITNSLDNPAASQVYTFFANAGNVASFAMNEIAIPVGPRAELYAPNGGLIDAEQGNSTAIFNNVVLPFTGTYTVLAMDDNGTETGSYEIGNLLIVTPPTAGFTFAGGTGCIPLTVQFTNVSSANATSFSWSFPGGTPSSSTLQNPVVIYNIPGTYSVTLTASNVAGSATFVQTNIIHAEAPPVPSFGFDANNLTVSFDNNSTNATSYMWDFGDNSTMSSEANPTHTYPADGTYTVTLTAKNDFCNRTTQQQIMVMTIGANEAIWVKMFRLFPNPSSGIFTINMTGTPTEQLDFELFDFAGKMRGKQSLGFGAGVMTHTFDFGDLPAAMYLLRVRAEERAFYVKVVVE